MTTELQDGVVTINGVQLHHTSGGAGNAETIVMVHAGICDRRMWAAQMEHFVERYRVVSFDMRGFGQTQLVAGEFALHEDLRGLLDALAIDKAWLLACSMGGMVAIDMTLLYPERVQGLLLSGPAISGYRYTGQPHPLSAAIEAAENAGDLARVCELELQMWVDGAGRKPQNVDPDVRQLVYDMNWIALNGDEDLWEGEQDLEPPALGRLADMDKPTLIIIGDLDVAASIERADLLATEVRAAQKVVMSGTAHLPNMEQPQRFNQIITAFLSAQP